MDDSETFLNCNLNKTGSVGHMVTDCPKWSELRKKYKIDETYFNLPLKSSDEFRNFSAFVAQVINLMRNSEVVTHPKTIIHIDIDYFYAQVELLKQPHLQNEPVGVKQKNLLVTCNYAARKSGVKKWIPVNEALKACPNLVLFNGENLYKYRHASNQIYSFLSTFTTKVEKCGFDENYLDVSDIVLERETKSENVFVDVVGHCIGDLNQECFCGCHKRLSIGSQIAYEIRTKLKSDLGFSSCCGISYNKLLAKVSSSTHKPNQQTTLLPNGTSTFLSNLKGAGGISGKTEQLLELTDIKTVKDLQEVDSKKSKEVFGDEATPGLKTLSFESGDSALKLSEEPCSVSLQDGGQKISVNGDVEEKFKMLLKRLAILVEADGRIPATVKVTVRKQYEDTEIGKKETKQSPVPASMFAGPGSILSNESTNELLRIVMTLFRKIVDVSKPFRVTLLGLAFSKFHKVCRNHSATSFLLEKRDLSVQSLASFASTTVIEPHPETSEPNPPQRSESDSDSDTEPSIKKKKFYYLDDGRRRLEGIDVNADLSAGLETGACSPSKLDLGNLTLNGDRELRSVTKCPPHVDPSVFRELPLDPQKKMAADWKATLYRSRPPRLKQRSMRSYYIPKNPV